MSDPSNTGPVGQDAERLSPEAQAVLGKARRSFGISIGILLLGFMAIGFAIVYRVMRDAPPPSMAQTLSVPAGAEVVSATTGDGAINVLYRLDGAMVLALFDRGTGEHISSVQIVADGAPRL
ncbi:DUF6476 family protein [Devosia sp. 1635]|uniref:DUF6476 family protein n=1 Tax=Devosia sp. 1635 TaxID=2726066 RepID=UPI001564CD57|nr:DUF6476 family protein [Devosia sp. 1635]